MSPFPIVYGLRSTPTDQLEELRRQIVECLVQTMKVKASHCMPLFPADLLGVPVEEGDGCGILYMRLDTGMFHWTPGGEKTQDELDLWAASVIARLVLVIWEYFSGQYEVEGFVGDLNPNIKILKKAGRKPTEDR